MSRRGLWSAAALVVVLVAGLAAVAWRGAHDTAVDAVRLGVLADHPIGVLPAGGEACQRPVDLDRPVTNVGLAVDTGGRPGPPLRLEIRSRATRRVLTSARVGPGYVIGVPDYLGFALPQRFATQQSVAVCARNEGRRPIQIVGDEAIEGANAAIDGATLPADWGVFFPVPKEADRPDYLALVPDILRRASVLRPGFIRPAAYVALAALLVIACPLLLWRAIRTADGSRR